ncbi:GspH/FimT family pseudopilin [Variovorax paradoxus]|nr:GspH/FimT family pseudopilin [Variovorax paradoxus]
MKNGFCASVRTHSHRGGTPCGFTLVEMMVAIALMGILLAFALPNFNSLIEKYRVERMASALMASVSHARAEAARRAETVIIRQRAECSGADWSCGWDTVVGSGTTAETLSRQDPDSRVAVGKSASGTMSFDAMGHSASVAGFRFYPAGNGNSSNVAVVCVALGGRIRLLKGRSSC